MNYKYIFLSAALCALTASCSESLLDLSPETNNVLNNYYKNEEQINKVSMQPMPVFSIAVNMELPTMYLANFPQTILGTRFRLMMEVTMVSLMNSI